MNFKFFVLLICFSFQLGLAAEECKFTPDIKSVIQKRINFLEEVENSLTQVFNEGHGLLPLSAIFSIEIDDVKAVQRRVRELENAIAHTEQNIFPYAEWTQCGHSKRTDFQQVLEKQKRVDQLKLQFLKLPRAKRQKLSSLYTLGMEQSKAVIELEDEAEASTVRIKEAESRMADKESVVDDEVTEEEGARSILEKYFIELEQNQIEFIAYRVERQKNYGQYQNEIISLSAHLETIKTGKDAFETFEAASAIWRKMADGVFEIYLSPRFLEVPNPPKVFFSTDPKLQLSLIDFKKRLAEISESRVSNAVEEKENISRLLLKTGQLRSQSFKKFLYYKNWGLFNFDGQMIHDFYREIRIVPFKLFSFVIAKVADVNAKIGLGFKGWVDLFVQALYLLLILVIPLVSIFLLNGVSSKVELFRRKMFSKSMLDSKQRTMLVIWIARINPFIPWIGILLLSYFFVHLLKKTDVSELSDFVVYLKFYAWYRIFRIVLKIGLERLFSQGSIREMNAFKEKISRTSLLVARVIFIEISFVHLVSNAVREVYVYYVLTRLITCLDIIIVFGLNYKWREEILTLSRKKNFKFLQTLTTGTIQAPLLHLLLPFIFSLTLIKISSDSAWRYLSTLDIFKWFNSELFKKKLEKSRPVEAIDTVITEDYLKFFRPKFEGKDEIYISPGISPKNEIFQMIQDWQKGKSSEDAIILHGNRGLGKSCLIGQLVKDLKGLRIFSFSVHEKILTNSDLYASLSVQLGTEIKNIQDFRKFDKELKEKAVIFIDDAQNLFLSKINGLEAYRELQDIVNVKTVNIFWSITLNTKSWNYLKGVFGKEHFYGRIFEMQPLRDTEIQELILSRHNQTGYSKFFNESIKAFSSDDGSLGDQAEVQFFRLLWGQSRGNPRAALVYWISALRVIEGTKSLQIGVPAFIDSSQVGGLTDEALFILAAITKHENLNSAEIIEVTGISESITRKSLKQTEHRGLIWCDQEGRFRIGPRAQYIVDFYLLGKNFIHE